MRRLLLSGLVVLGTLASARAAHAECGIPTWLGSPAMSVPIKGTLYFHNEVLGWDVPPSDDQLINMKIAWEGGEGTVRWVRVEGALAAIEYDGWPGSKLRIYDQWDEVTEMRLDPSWAPPTSAPRVLQSWHHKYAWTCSEADSLMIQIDQPTAAVRVHWTVNGHSVDYIEATRNDESKSVLELGKINCGRPNVPVEQLYDGVDLELYAIRADGSEVRIEGMPSHVALGKLAVDEGGLDHAFTIVATQEPAQADTRPAPRVRVQGSRALGGVILALAGVGVLLALWLIRRAETAASDCSPAS